MKFDQAGNAVDDSQATDHSMTEKRKKYIVWLIAELRAQGVMVNVRNVGGDANQVITVKSRIASAGVSRANPVSRNQLVGMVKEGDATIIDRLINGGYIQWDTQVRRGGGYQLTAKGFKIASQTGSMITFDARKTIKAIGLTAVAE